MLKTEISREVVQEIVLVSENELDKACKGSRNTQEKWWHQNFGNSNSRRQNRTNGCEDVL